MSKKPPHAAAPFNVKVVHQPAWDVRQIIWSLFEGFYAYAAIRQAATVDLLQAISTDRPQRVMKLQRSDGTHHQADFDHYLKMAFANDALFQPLQHAWAVGALMSAADALAYYRYFDRAPCLELIYHLRNGVGHGNHFTFDQRARKRLQDHPAHNRASIRGIGTHEITGSLEGDEVLDGFMNVVDVQDCFQAATHHLEQMARGAISSKP